VKLPYRTFYIYECDGRGRPVTLLAERSSRTSAEAVSRYLYIVRAANAVADYLRLKGNLVALTTKIGRTESVQPPVMAAKNTVVAKSATEQLDLF